jgi:hypothetical protein
MAYGHRPSQMCAHASCSGTTDCTYISTSLANPLHSSASSCTSAWWKAMIPVSACSPKERTV